MVSLFLKHLEFERKLSPHSVAAYATDLGQFSDFLENTFEIIETQKADFQMLRSWVAALSDQKLNPRSINRKIACLKSYFQYLLRQGAITTDPAKRLKALKTDKPIPYFVEEKSMDLLLNQMEFPDGFEGQRDRLVLELFYGTGLRLAELLALSISDFDLTKNTIKIIGKGNKERLVPMSSTLKTAYIDYLSAAPFEVHTPLILTDKGTPAYRVFVQRLVAKYLGAVSTLSKKSPHILRHTFATHLLNNGAEIKAIKDLLGHANLAATQIYTHNSIERLKNIHEKAHPKGLKP